MSSFGKISAFVISLNEEKNIGRCLESLKWADEIVLVDSGSEDGTLDIARRYTNKIFFKKFIDYADQKNYALSLTQGPWCLSVDADEEVSGKLKEEILSIVNRAGGYECYSVPRCSYIFGRKFSYTGTQKDCPIRFFMKRNVVFEQPIHEVVRFEGIAGMLKNSLNHYTYQNLSDYLTRLNRYTSAEAVFMTRSGRVPRKVDIYLKPFVVFLKLFFLEQGFRDGFEGFLFSFLSGYYALIKHLKHLELSGLEHAA